MFKFLIRTCFSLVGLEIRRKRLDFQKQHDKGNWGRVRKLPKIRTLVDVGIGQNGTPYLWKHFINCQFIFIDPLEECRSVVENYLEMNNHNIFIPTALGATNNTTTINVANSIHHSSLLDRTSLSYKGEPVERRLVPLRRLDDVVARIKLKYPLGIKIDTEGYELEVLKGAYQTLIHTAFVIMEVRYRKSFEGSYSFFEIMKYMVQAGFIPFDVLEINKRCLDMVFINTRK